VRFLAAAALVLLVTAPAAANPPRAGVFAPGRSLGGLRLGATPAQVRSVWGSRFGRCRGCTFRTWYYTYEQFRPQGVGVEFRRGHVAAVFTLWRPSGWRTAGGIRLGDRVERVTTQYGALERLECGAYSALLLRRGQTVSAFYVVDGRLWGFGLLTARAPACR
jgi:hypothetical protein